MFRESFISSWKLDMTNSAAARTISPTQKDPSDGRGEPAERQQQ
jgi:hypothetical protein